MYTIYLKEEDMIKPNHFPIIALLNEAYNHNPILFINNLCKEIGSGYDYTCCTFYSELDEYDKQQTPPYEGLFIETDNDEVVIISMEELIHYLDLITLRYTSTVHDNYVDLMAQITTLKSIYKK